MEFHLGMDEQSAKSIWLRIKGRAGIGDIAGICYPTRKNEWVRSSIDR